MNAVAGVGGGAVIRKLRAAIRILGWFGGVGILLLMIPTVADVAYRKFFGPSIPGVIEFSEVGLVIVIIFGMGAALTDGAHICTPIMIDRLSPPTATTLRLIGRLIVGVMIAVMIVGTLQDALEAFAVREYRFGLIEVPVWPAKLAIPIGLSAILLEIGIQVVEAVQDLASWRRAFKTDGLGGAQ